MVRDKSFEEAFQHDPILPIPHYKNTRKSECSSSCRTETTVSCLCWAN